MTPWASRHGGLVFKMKQGDGFQVIPEQNALSDKRQFF
jgi:hypothetical protein